MRALTKAMVLLLSLQTSRTAASRAFSCSLSSAATRRSGRAASLGLSKYSRTSLQTSLFLRGGSDDDALSVSHQGKEFSTSSGKEEQKYVTLSEPAPGSPFHYAFPVHSLEEAKQFYGQVLGCQEGRSSEKWQDYSLHGHQIVCHWVGNDYRCIDYYNPVDGDEVPVPHAGLALTVDEFHALAKRVKEAGVDFIIEPHLRFQGMPGEQWTMFFKDPSGNNLEFKAMTKVENLFAKYNVVD
ncbi:hypothetical protein ACHAWO_001891 [Cyclotella atomus]|uniref:VOC domain-containing protein n=1 Tax=Cyclotella atomus TaxID=382360 RepID=A0ABD3NIB9_9STRA